MMKKIFIAVAGLILLVLCSCGVATGFGFLKLADASKCEGYELNTFESVRKMMPASGTVISDSCASFLGLSLHSEFTMPAGDLDLYQNAVNERFKYIKWYNTIPENFTYEEKLANMTSYQIGHLTDGVYHIQVIVDTSDPETYHVYYSEAHVD